jgi:hypothetical protein
MRRTLLLLSCLLTLCGGPGFAIWKTLKTDSFVLFYPAGRESQALDALGSLERHRGYVEALIGRAGGRLPVVLADAGTESNGYADFIFRRIHLYLYPPSVEELAFSPSWWDLVGVHEYSHWLHLTSASGLPAALAWALGDAYAPNGFVPDWLAEGMAVYAESGITPYGGRLNDGTFDAYLAVRLLSLRPPSLAEATFAPPAYPGGTGPYLFGGEFIHYLAETYGREALTRFIRQNGRAMLSYLSPLLPLVGLDRTARAVFGKRFAALWQDWILWETRRLSSRPVPGQPISPPAWRLGNPVVYDGRLYSLRSLPTPAGPFEIRWRHELRVLDPFSGKERLLLRSASSFTQGLRMREGRLYYAVEELRPGLANVEMLSYGACSVIYAYDLQRGRSRRVLRYPLRAFEPLPGGDIVLSKDRTDGFGSEILLWKRKPEAGEVNPRLLLRSEYLVREMLVEGERILISARLEGENFRIHRVQPGSFQARPIVAGPYASGGMSLAGDRLLFVANENGRYAVYAGDPDAAEEFRPSVRLTDADYASAAAYDPTGGRLYYKGLHAGGYALFGMDLDLRGVGWGAAGPEPQAASLPAAGAKDRTAPAEVPARRGGYGDNLLTLFPRLITPTLSLDTVRGRYLAGLSVLGTSALGDIRYHVSGLLDVQTGAPAAQGGFCYLLPPLTFSLLGSTLDSGSLEATLEAPLLRRLTPLGHSLTLGLSAVLSGADLAARYYEPFLGFSLAGPLNEIIGTVGAPFERLELGSLQNSLAVRGQIAFTQALLFGALKVSLLGIHDFERQPWRLPAPRGYSEGLAASSGFTLDLDIALRLLKIRQGFWNPPLYVQDVYFSPFATAALNEELELQAAGGLEMHWEIKVLAAYTGWPVDLILRAAVNREGLFSFGFFLAVPELLEELCPIHQRRIAP